MKKFLKISKFLLIFLIITGWIFFGFPQIWNNPPFPPKIKTSYALNQVNNWSLATSTAYFLTTNDGTGTDICGGNTATAKTAMATFAWSAGTLKGTSGTAASTVYKAYATQSYTTPTGGSTPNSILVKGQFAWSTTGGTWKTNTASSTYARLDIYDSANSTFIANLGCAGAVSAVTATSTFSADTYLTANTTYTIRATVSAQQKAGSGQTAINISIDNIDVNAAPVGLSASALTASTTVSLAWTASTAGADGTNGLNATPYKVYRSTSPTIVTSTDFLANGTTTAYSDTTPTGNTTYYYAVTDVDTSSVGSPVSATSSILTLPGKPPNAPTFSSITSTTLTVSWNLPQGSTTNSLLERCTGASCSSFVNIATTTASSYDDSGLTAGTTYDYRVRGNNATGNGDYSATGETTTTAVSLTFTVDAPSVTFVGGVTPGTPVSTSSVLTVNTNNSAGYTISLIRASTTPTLFLTTDTSTTIADNPNSNNWTAPAATSTAGASAVWTSGTTQGLGFRLKLTGTVANTYSSTWWGTDDTAANALYSGISTSTATGAQSRIVNTTLGAGSDEKTVVEYRVDVVSTQKSGAYISSPVTYTALAN